jgi:tetratricopeptide (TPR) repeat protein
MTELFLDRCSMPTAAVGPSNPLPPLRGDASLAKDADLSAAPSYMQANAAYGRVATISPYLMQDGYGRHRTVQSHRVAVIENEHLRATFLLAAGGRLWSLVDKGTDTELLYTNPVFQPANLALRSAWFAGGVEWNIGTIGHTPLTCEPMHAARVIGDDGEPVLRLYEFERLRRVVYQLDVHLPPGSTALYVHIRIVNPNDTDVPMYWWSNIAVPQRPDTRVLAPADSAWSYSYDDMLRHEPVAPGGAPGSAGYDAAADVSYPARFADAADFFFDLGSTSQPWIAAVDGAGAGLFQTSTRQLMGRKLFRWGTSTGGQRWQQWLSGPVDGPAGGYAEIQSGLARTQFEHLRMRPGTTWSWTEAFGPVHLSATKAHGPWPMARAAAEQAVTAAVSSQDLNRVHNMAADLAEREPAMLLHQGTGWGALEAELRSRSGEPPLPATATPFDPVAVGAEQRPWLNLLQTGQYPNPSADHLLGSAPAHPVVMDALAAVNGWAAAALLGTAQATLGRWDDAATSWKASIKHVDNAYARRNLAVAALRDGRIHEAADEYRHALAVSRRAGREPHLALLIEAVATLIEAGAADEALQTVESANGARRQHGRLRLLEARAALAAGQLDHCGAILSDPAFEVADLREGEDSLDGLWWDYQAARLAAERGPGPELRAEAEHTGQLPAHLDFRMKPSGAE